MFPSIRYLDFAVRWFASVDFDLASSGIQPAPSELLGAQPLDDYSARGAFTTALAARYGVSPAEVVPALGASGAIFVVMASLCRAGDRVAVERPGYEPLYRVPEALGLGVDYFQRDAAADYVPDPAAIAQCLTERTRVVVLTNPHNPSARLIPNAVLQEVAGLLAKRDGFLFVDEAYLEAFEPGTSARRLGDNVVTCSSATKCWGVPWARAGWVLLPERLAPAALEIERHVMGGAPPACWAYGAAALARAEELALRAAELQRGKRELVDAFLAAHPCLEWSPPPPQAAYGWVRDARGGSIRALVERHLERERVIVSPGEFFGEAASFRLSWTAKPESVREGLSRLARTLELGT